MKRRILSIITALALCLGMCPPVALAAGTEVTVGTAEELIAAVNQALQTDEPATIKLTADIEVNHERDNVGITFISPNYEVKTGNIILDCGGHTLTSSKGITIVMNCKSLTIKNGTIKNEVDPKYSTGCGVTISGGNLTVEKSAEIIAENNSSDGLLLVDEESTAHVYGKVSGSQSGIFASWGVVNLYSGAVISGRTNAIRISQGNGTVNLAGGAKAYLNGGEAIDEITADTAPGTMVICDSHNLGGWDANGQKHCPTCGYTERAQAKVEKGGNEPYFVSKIEAAFNGGNDGATVTLMDNVDLGYTPIQSSCKIILNLNGKTITSGSPVFIISSSSASLTINGGGSITGSPAIILNSSTLTVNGGTITGGINNYSGGKVQLRGGTFKGAQADSPCLYDEDSVRNLLGNEGDRYYAYFDTDGNPLPEYKTKDESLSGTVVVKECTHYKAYEITDTTHQQYCTACGKLFDTGPVTHSPADGTCTACGYMAKPVQVSVGGGEAEITTLQEAWTKALTGTNATITLLGDVHENKIGAGLGSVTEGKTVTINGNGHSFGKFGIPVNGGTVNVNNCVLYNGANISGGTATFYGCDFRVAASGNDVGVKAEGETAELEFTDCKFIDQKNMISGKSAAFTKCEFNNTLVYTDGKNSTFDKCKMNTEAIGGNFFGIGVAGPALISECEINVTNGVGIYIFDEVSRDSVKLKGGKFSGDFGAIVINSSVDDFTVADLLYNDATTRYAYYDKDGKAVKPVGEWIEGPVTVEVCRESHDIHHVEGTLTHSQSCEYCGYGDSGPEKCSYTASGETLTCSECGDTLTVTATAPASLVYDGSEKKYTVSVKRGEEELTEEQYTVYHGDNKNAGTAELTVTIGENQGLYTKNFTIAPKSLTVTGAALTSRVYDGTKSVAVTGVTLEGVVDGESVAVDTANLKAEISSADVGTYSSAALPELTLTGATKDNYILTQPSEPVSANVKIQKADALTPKPGDLAVANKQAHTYTFGLGSLLPDLTDGKSLGNVPVTYTLGDISLGDYYTTGAAISGQTLTLPINEVNSSDAVAIGTVAVTIKTGNYKDMTATINVRSVNKTIPTGGPTLSAATITYGQALGSITLSGSMLDGDKPVPGTFAWAGPNNRPAAQEDYAAAWVFTPVDGEKYAIVNGTSSIKVEPASISGAKITLSETAYRYDGKAHKPGITSVKLGDTVLTAGVDYTAEIPSGTGAGTYTVTVTGKGNYAGTATAKYTINPVKTVDLPESDGKKLKLELETGLSTIPDTLKAEYESAAKIEDKLKTVVTAADTSIPKENTAVYDAELLVSTDDGKTWKPATKDNFPSGGLTITLPYPQNTDSSYTFTVVHMFTTGEKAGETETLTGKTTADGVQCTVTGLSPISLGWVKKTSQGGSSGGGWYPSVSYYSVKVDKTEHGTVTASPTSASSGSTVTLNAKPDEGYKLDKITVTDSQGKAVEVTEKSGKYTFKMPSRNVTIEADFVPAVSPSPSPSGSPTPTTSPSPSPDAWKNPFPDVSNTGWYIKAIEYVCTNGLMAGYSNGKFGPNDTLTRAQFAQIIYNKEGQPKADSGRFTDVTTGWYANAVNWAAAEGIVAGVGGGKFAPDQPISRQDLAVMLWRYAGSPDPRKNELDFSDAGKVSTYAWKALCWANENGIVGGKGNRVLDPKGKATRAEAAQMLKNYIEDQKDKS